MTLPQQPDDMFITIGHAADLLHCSQAAIRQRSARNCFRTKHKGRNVLVALEDVLRYNSDKKRVPSWEENKQDLRGKKLVSIKQAVALTSLGETYIRTLIRNKTLEGYITIDGEILMVEESLNVYLNRGNQNDTNSKVSAA